MRNFAVLEFYQETNSFNPRIATWQSFESCKVAWGAEMVEKTSGDSAVSGMRAALAAAPASGFEPLPLGSLNGLCGGRVADDVIEGFWRRIIERLRQGGDRVEGVLMLLHGACASQTRDDVEGWMIRQMRRELGDRPIVVGLDHHANITGEIVSGADIVVGYRTEPHYPYETGMNATRLLLAVMSGELRPAMAWRKIPMIAPMDQFETASGPMRELFDLAREAEEQRGVVSVSPFPMQPWLDVEEGGWSVIAVTDGSVDPDPIAARIAEVAWALRARFWETSGVPLDACLSGVTRQPGLVVLHDTGDSVFAGSTGDCVALLERLAEGVEDPAAVSVVSPAAVAIAYQAGLGRAIGAALGGDPICGTYLRAPAEVIGLAEGPVAFESFYGLGSVDEGRCALLRIGPHVVNVTERAVFGGNDPALYERYGVRLDAMRYAAVKIAADYDRFRRWRVQKIRVDTPGCSQSDLRALPWQRLPRPIAGLDDGVAWRSGAA